MNMRIVGINEEDDHMSMEGDSGESKKKMKKMMVRLESEQDGVYVTVPMTHVGEGAKVGDMVEMSFGKRNMKHVPV